VSVFYTTHPAVFLVAVSAMGLILWGFMARRSACVILILLVSPFITTSLYAGYDSSLRVDINFSAMIDERFKFLSYMFQQINNNMSDCNYLELGTGLQYMTCLRGLSFLVYYQQAYSKNGARQWLLEQKPSINMNMSAVFSHFKISNQVRYEYRITSEWHDFRIKNYLEISLHDIMLHPYTGWELFYENHDKSSLLNRIKVGIIQNVYRSISLGTYYRIDFLIKKQWEFTRHLVGFKVAISY